MTALVPYLGGSRESVERDAAFERVASLARRAPCPPELVEHLSLHLRVRERDDDGRPNMLRADQTTALRELWEVRGLFAPMRVGSGKTLVTLLAATLLGAQRPVLMVPASLREKTRREFAQYRQDWRVRLPAIVSYQELGHPLHEARLFELQPDLLLLDEAHKLRNPDSAVTRRVGRYIRTASPIVAVLSGTLMTSQLMDYWHLVVWALGELAPVPTQQGTAERWAQALDRDVAILDRIDEGALSTLPGGFHEWFRGSRGIVTTPGSDCAASIQIARWRPTLPKILQDAIQYTETTRQRPDGELMDDWEIPDILCQLCQGFYYVWDPLPPPWWLMPRKAWFTYVRAVLDEHLEGFDSPAPIALALDRWGSALPPAAAEGKRLLQAWRDVKDRFEPNPVPVWLDVTPLVQAVKHAGPRDCIIWTRHAHAGIMLERLGVPYFGGGGANPENATPGQTIACSIQAHGTGRNLQYHWHRNLFLAPLANPDGWEQTIGRTHRQGQPSDTVFVDIIDAIGYHDSVLKRARSEARASAKASGFSYKLVDADWLDE